MNEKRRAIDFAAEFNQARPDAFVHAADEVDIGGAAESTEALPGLEHGVLDGVFGLGLVPEHPERQPVGPGQLRFQQLHESSLGGCLHIVDGCRGDAHSPGTIRQPCRKSR